MFGLKLDPNMVTAHHCCVIHHGNGAPCWNRQWSLLMPAHKLRSLARTWGGSLEEEVPTINTVLSFSIHLSLEGAGWDCSYIPGILSFLTYSLLPFRSKLLNSRGLNTNWVNHGLNEWGGFSLWELPVSPARTMKPWKVSSMEVQWWH